MGFRMYIEYNGNEYGGDHKLYGYEDLKNLSSFKILVPEIIRQWKIDPDLNNVELVKVYEDIYQNYFIVSNATENLKLDSILFSIFAKRYCQDLRNRTCYDNPEIVNSAIKYIEQLINTPGDKILYWA